MRSTVERDFDLVIGGPIGAKRLIASFRAGSVLEVEALPGGYPQMYRIRGIPCHEFSRGILTQFLRGFDTRPGA